jgi:hypothetical protein
MKNPHAVALGKLGGKRKEWARLGGLARAKKYPKALLKKWAKRGGRPPKKGDRK